MGANALLEQGTSLERGELRQILWSSPAEERGEITMEDGAPPGGRGDSRLDRGSREKG